MSEFLAFAVQVAREVGGFLRDAQNGAAKIEVDEKRPNDLVTQFDCEADKRITALIRARYPEHSILAEESGVSGVAGKYCWIVDPIDGTTNFAHGIPMFAISIALRCQGELIAAVVYNPMIDEMFTASKNGGAYLNGKRLQVSNCSSLSKALVSTGFPCKDPDHVNDYMLTFESVMRRCQGIRRGGAASIDLAYLAAGRHDGFWEFTLQDWDVAAGILLIKEAGGFVCDLFGGNAVPERGLVAGTKKVLAELLEITKTVACK